MSKIKAEYIWIDGYRPTANLRSKTKIVSGTVNKLADLPIGDLTDQVLNRQVEIIVIAH